MKKSKKISLTGLVFAQMRGRKYYCAAMLFFLSLTAVFLVLGFAFSKGAVSSFEKAISRLGAEIIVMPSGAQGTGRELLLAGEPESVYMDRSVAETVKAVEGVESVSVQLFMESASASCCDQGDTLLIGFELATDFTLKHWIGESYGSGEDKSAVIVGSKIQRIPGIPVKFYNQKFIVRAQLDATGIDFFDRAVFIPIETAYEMIKASRTREDTVPLNIPPDSISAVLVRTSHPAELVADRIVNNVRDVKVFAAKGFINDYRKGIASLQKLAVVLLGLLAGSCLVGWTFILFISIFSRKSEVGLLRAMGASRAFVVKLFVFETFLISAVGTAIGLITGYFLLWLFRDYFLYQLNIVPTGFSLICCVAILVSLPVIGVAASMFPLIKTAAAEPYSVIREGGYHGSRD